VAVVRRLSNRDRQLTWRTPAHFTWLKGFASTPNTDFAYNINGSGTVVGSSNTSTQAYIERAFRWTEGSAIVELGTFGGEDSFAYSISHANDIVGHAEYAPVGGNPAVSAAFLWTGGVMTDLSNQIVGPKPTYLGDQSLMLKVNKSRVIAGACYSFFTNFGTAPGKAAFLLVPTTNTTK